jgi:D-glycerate 3-kinase
MNRSTATPVDILHRWQAGDRPIARDLRSPGFLGTGLDDVRSRAFGITPENAADVVRCKTDLFFSLLDELPTLPLKSTCFSRNFVESLAAAGNAIID